MTRAMRGSVLLAILFMVIWLALPARSFATLVYSCPSAANCNGNDYAVAVDSHVGNTYTMEIDVKVTSSYTGNQFTDTLGAIALKDFAASFTSASPLSAPGGLSNWTFTQVGLNNSGTGGCVGPTSNGVCFDENGTFKGAPLVGAGTILTFKFQFNTTSVIDSSGNDLKFLYEDTNDNKVGDLGSFDIPIQDCTGGCGGSSPPPIVPEPGTLFVFGSGLAGLALFRRYKKRA